MKLVIHLTTIFLLSVRGESNDIDGAKDSVIRLNAHNFGAQFYTKETAWMLLVTKSNFHYAHRFEYIFMRVANLIKSWKSIASLGVLDCEVFKNIDLCRKFHVKRFPQILFLPADVAVSNVSYPYSPERYGDLIEQTPQRLKNLFIDFLCSEISKPTAIWPELSAFPELDEKNIWYKVSPNVKSVAIVFDSNSDYFGREVILNSLSLRHCVTVVRGVLKTAKFPKIKHFKEPFMIHSQRGQGNEFLKAVVNNTEESFCDYLIKFAEECMSNEPEVIETFSGAGGTKPFNSISIQSSSSDLVSDDPVPSSFNAPSGSWNGNQFTPNPNVLYLQDLESAFNYIFISEVRVFDIIVGDELKALNNFMQMLFLYFPASNQIKLLLGNFHSWMKEQSNDIPSELYDFKIHDLKTRFEHKFEEIPWVGCKGSRHYFRGYPCGLWMAFHAMTVSYYNNNSSEPHFEPLLVLSAIKDYVHNFFGCFECVNHFYYIAENLQGEVNSKEDSVLWLWRAHNQINKRVMMDNNEDPYHPNMQFPTEEQCSVCQTFVKEDGDIQWDEREVLKFLIKFYSENLVWGSDFQRIY